MGFGALAALAFVPFSLLPVLLISFPALILLLRGTETKRQVFATGWAFAFGMLLVNLHWIAGALFVEIKSFWWVLPLAVAGLPALFAVYYGLACIAARRWGLDRGDHVLAFGFFWFLADLARAHLLTGFPWDITGYVWDASLPVLQSVSLFGIEGLSLLTLLFVGVPVLALNRKTRRLCARLAVVGVLLFGGLGYWGHARLAMAGSDVVPDVRLRLVQPNLSQSLKWVSDQRLKNFDELLDVTFKYPGEKPVTHYIWPETATAYYLSEEPLVRERLARLMPSKSILLTGVVRRAAAETGGWNYYNSLIAMDAGGRVLAGYDKHHLVPFGEYMPLRTILPFRVVTALGTDFTPGPGVRTMRAPFLPPFSPLVCYEAIFSGEVVEAEDPPAFLLNVTNDAWYEGTIGPAQHFAMTRARAIEEGLPFIRVSNKGVVAVMDSVGRIRARAENYTQGYVDSDLPTPNREYTNVRLWGGYPAAWLTLFVGVALLMTWLSLGKNYNK